MVGMRSPEGFEPNGLPQGIQGFVGFSLGVVIKTTGGCSIKVRDSTPFGSSHS